MPEITTARAFTVALDDGSKVKIAKGVQTVEDHIASHWMVKANIVGAKPNPGAGTPAFMRAAAEERARIEAEHARLEADTEARVTASVREKMEAAMQESIRVQLERQAAAAAKGEAMKSLGIPALDSLVETLVAARVEEHSRTAAIAMNEEIEKRVAAARTEIEGGVDAKVDAQVEAKLAERVTKAVEEALLEAEIKAEEAAKSDKASEGAGKGGKGSK